MHIKHHAARGLPEHSGPHVGGSLSDFGGGSANMSVSGQIVSSPFFINKPNSGVGAASATGGTGSFASGGRSGSPIQSDNFGQFSTGLSPLNKL